MMHGSATQQNGRGRPLPRRKLTAFTRIDLLVVLIVISALIAVMLPLQHYARESSRREQCINNLKQLGLACMNHESAMKCLPTNGWGNNWIGYAGRGAGEHQPSGWFYNILPYLEQSSLYKGPLETPCRMVYKVREIECPALIDTPLPCFLCPSRRSTKPYPYTHPPAANNGATSYYTTSLYCDAAGKSLRDVTKADYAGNGGSYFWTADTLPGDKMCDAGGPVGTPVLPAADPYELFDKAFNDEKPIEDGTGRWKLTPQQGIAKFAAAADGVFAPFNAITTEQITDGASNTYLCGEKSMPAEHYEDGLDPGDNQCVYMGHDDDNTRWACPETTGDPVAPFRDPASVTASKVGAGLSHMFGGPHAGVFNMAFCDGSVRSMNYGLDPLAHANLANRRDGQKIDPQDY